MLAVGGRQAVHFINFRTRVSSPGRLVNPIVPPLICTLVAFAAYTRVAALISTTPPRVNSQFISGSAGTDTLIAVKILKFLVAPI